MRPPAVSRQPPEAHVHADVVIVGAGVAGLTAAQHLTRAGAQVLVLEAAGGIGGRMSTEKVDGFRLDRIGQLLSTSYPGLRHTPGLDGLVLRPFSPGVLVHSEGRHHRAGEPAGPRRTRGALSAARALASAPRTVRGIRPPLGGPLDHARLGTALARLAATPPARLLARPELPIGRALTARGLPPRVLHGFVRPLLSALLCDPDLTTSSRCADLALHAYATGRLAVPEGGADALPEQLASTLPPGTVRTGVRVTAVAANSVTTAEHGRAACRAVLLATDAVAAAGLLPGLRVPAFHEVTVVHHAVPEPPLAEPALLLDADRPGPVAHTSVISQVDPTRAPAGRALVSSTVLGPPPAEHELRSQLAALYGTSTSGWETLAVHHDPRAVPAMPAPHDPRRPVRLLDGLYVCGDHRDTSTVQGALHSGRRAARAVLADLGLPEAVLPGVSGDAPVGEAA
ncbi:NAD(P)/FAD-dependent oxidoreductase [Streptomyces longispororuber]|uniref:NAD(P)/FAD-dependent oxidoreductase n=1 Tax=Streptomyces longispororuber TaxID=68230 RepID=UPI00210C737C|nr:NAD(P)/FAD-dependent oxidoreductase [Streptomyces longispororuber]MCQ4207146.1 NAD(P)/FAD-dependent oxidoreductase [Streptomyces longispororuber]